MVTSVAAAAAGSWKSLLLAAIESNSHLKHSSYFQLATISSTGRPANRTVVFRGFQDGTDKIQITSDIRTNKIEDIRHCPFGEICWYFTDTWEQLRIGGRIEVIDGSNEDPAKLMQREKSWFAISLKSLFQYIGPVPRLPILRNESVKKIHIDQSSGPVDTFCLLIFDPDQQREKSWFASSLKSRFQYIGPAPRLPILRNESVEEIHIDQSSGPVDTFCLLIFDPDQVDYLNLKRNERLIFSSTPNSDGCKIWMSEQTNP